MHAGDLIVLRSKTNNSFDMGDMRTRDIPQGTFAIFLGATQRRWGASMLMVLVQSRIVWILAQDVGQA